MIDTRVGGCVVREKIGDGGMGVVYRGRHENLEIDVAVKFLHRHQMERSEIVARFLAEARRAAQLNSARIVRVLDCGKSEGQPYIIMEYVDGQSLADHLKERKALPVGRALQIAESVARALWEAHDEIGLIHRDVKPGNILLTRNGQVKLADLGLAKLAVQEAASMHTAAGVVLGTLRYMPPEQFRDAASVDHRADIFSLGATLYEMLAGKHAFAGESIYEVSRSVEEDEPALPGQVPQAVRGIVRRMLQKQREQRFQQYAELVTALQAAQKSLGEAEANVQATLAAAATSGPFIPEVRLTGSPAAYRPTENRVLLVVDVQNDFCPNGALAVPGGDEIVPIINKLSRRFAHVVLTQDWHGEDHLSFASSHPGKKPLERVQLSYGEQILWPDHCVQGTEGAAFHPDLDVGHCELVIRKGYHRDVDSYSAFFENDRQTPTGLAGYLRERGLTRLFIVGLATDFCVAYSALDARRLGFEVTVIEAGCRGIDVHGSLALAWRQMDEAGVTRA